ncbi:MAG: ABC-2 type transport system ATP-binding protein [Candidatus Krumholzibacteriia bacterium]|jgi:ABC-2 type transport system ATP-binding protein
MLIFHTVAINKPDADTYPHGGGSVAVPQEEAMVTVRKTPSRSAVPALSVIDLQKSFRSGILKRKIRGIEGVSFTVVPGEVFAIIGHNGAGKTTTINCILDLIHPDGGEVRLMGLDHRKRESRTKVGYLPERPYFFEHLNGIELLAFYAELLGVPASSRQSRIDHVLARTGMTEFATRRLKKYSKGMLQRIGIAQTLLGEPDILILDEPMSGLDPMGRREIRELLLELKAEGKTIILSSHIVSDVELVADTVGIMQSGKMIAVHDLHSMQHDSSYHVVLSCRTNNPRNLNLPRWAESRLQNSGREMMTVDADSIDQLRELLGACHAENIEVKVVESRRTGLEDMYIASNCTNSAEVAS